MIVPNAGLSSHIVAIIHRGLNVIPHKTRSELHKSRVSHYRFDILIGKRSHSMRSYQGRVFPTFPRILVSATSCNLQVKVH